MNIFERENAWLGAADFVAGHDTLESFLSQARIILRRLGARAYKLDEYIRQLLIACSTPMDEVFSADDPLTRPLSAQCRRAAQGLPPEQERQDLFAREVQEYAAKHRGPRFQPSRLHFQGWAARGAHLAGQIAPRQLDR